MANYQSTFSTSALLGFVGGDQSTSALSTAYVSGRRRIPSFINAPGSFATAAAFNALSKARVWDGLHPHSGVTVDPAALTPSKDISPGPKYTACFSGTVLSATGPIAKQVLEYSRTLPVTTVSGRRTSPFAVTIVELPDGSGSESLPVAKISAPTILPILASGAAAGACGMSGDWISMSMILFGMLCNGVSSYALQAGDLTYTRPVSTAGAPAGDGYLEIGDEIIILKGSEAAVSSVTRGRFSLRYKSEASYGLVAACGGLLTAQCIVQLLLVPMGTVVGQLCFLLSVVISWIYNAYVSRQEKVASKRLVLEDLLKAPAMERYSLGTRAAAAVFLMQELKPSNVEEQLALLVPNNTPVWKAWREIVASELQGVKPNFRTIAAPPQASQDEDRLLATLLADAQSAIDAFTHVKV